MWMRVQAVVSCARSKPFGQSSIGVRSVSWVGVIADLAIHSSGPRPTTTRNISVATLSAFIAQSVRRCR